MDDNFLYGLLESLIFASGTPLDTDQIRQILGSELPKDFNHRFQSFLQHIYERKGGIIVREVAGGYQFVTRTEFSSYIRKLQTVECKSRLSRAACETLAIIAYRQPITAPEIEHLRGVDSSGVIKNLLDKELLTILGRKHGPGNPLLYGTTTKFLVEFGLNDLNSLPDLSEFEKALSSMDPQQELPFPQSKTSSTTTTIDKIIRRNQEIDLQEEKCNEENE